MSEPIDPPDSADRLASDLLSALPGPLPGAELRVRHAVRTSLATPRPGWRRVAVGVGTLGALAAAAVAVVALWPSPPAPPTPVTLALQSPDGWRSESIDADVSLSFSGNGEVAGTTRAPRIDWERGTLNVEVVPNKGVDLSVATREAQVRVIGTGFTVTRDALGTHVAVLHGKVAVTCTTGESGLFEAGASQTCLPTSPAALLGRARALEGRGAPATEVLATLDRALSAAASGPVAEELQVRRIEALAAADRPGEALSAARAYLASAAELRRIEVLRMAATLSWSAGGCDRARADLASLAAAPDATPEDRARLSACLSPSPR